MRDDIKPPVPVKEAPAVAASSTEPAQPAEKLAAAPAAEPAQPVTKHRSGAPVVPVIFAIIIFMVLAAAAYAVFRGM